MADKLRSGNGSPCPPPSEIIRELSSLDLYHLGTFSAASYDTAWLSMIYTKITDHGTSELLFPQCFSRLQATQKQDGTWESYSSQVDGILNTLAALLALTDRRAHILPDSSSATNLDHVIEKAQSGAQTLLLSWDVTSTVHVGFEIIVTSLLDQLASHSISFEFPASSQLRKLYQQKMLRFSPEVIYSGKKTTVLHSLEALTDTIDFDRVRHHCSEDLGIFGSPASTAAYLIHSREWDERAEKYLRRVLEAYGNEGRVPSAFPTPIFELSWAVSFLLSQPTSLYDLDAKSVNKIASFLASTIDKQHGVVGFAPGILEDADDTARTLITLKRLGRSADPTQMLSKFEAGNHFRTYELERNPSFSANCNVLLVLLTADTVDQYQVQIEKTVEFLLDVWEAGEVVDKWNLNPIYSAMLLAEAFLALLTQYGHREVDALPSETVLERVSVVICQIVRRILGMQEEDGSWENSLEATSYAVVTLLQGDRLPWDSSVRTLLDEAISRGRNFIKNTYSTSESNCYFWVEKTTYQSTLLKTAFCSIALHGKCHTQNWPETISNHFKIPDIKKAKKMQYMLTKLPIFAKASMKSVDLLSIETMHASKRLKQARSYILDRDGISFSTDKYLEFIPMIWLACNDAGSHVLSSRVVSDMVLISLFNYQIDEFMESVVAELNGPELEVFKAAVRDECKLTTDLEDYPEPPIAKALTTLWTYVSHVLTHPSVLQSPPRIQRQLSIELHNYLLGQITHNVDNALFLQQQAKFKYAGYVPPDLPRSSFFKWVHSTGADDTSCPFSFIFFVCLISSAGDTCLGESTQTRYYSQSLARHLAVMCRMYNDFGSVVRDKEEGNLNSINFAEFSCPPIDENVHEVKITLKNGSGNRTTTSTAHTHTTSAERAKQDLMALAEFERAGVNLALQNLSRALCNPVLMKKIQVFVDVTDTFGQMYVVKDIASRNEAKKTS